MTIVAPNKMTTIWEREVEKAAYRSHDVLGRILCCLTCKISNDIFLPLGNVCIIAIMV